MSGGQKKFSQLPADGSPTTNDSIPTYDADTSLTKRSLISTLISLFFNNVTDADLATMLARLPIGRNWLINGGMDIWQRNTSATPNDDVYSGADRWNFLTETNGAWTVARDTDVPSTGGARYSMKCSNVTLNNQMAIVQILEGKDAKDLAGKTVSLSFYAKTNGTEIGALRAAILSWTGTEDSVTSDVIGTWAQNGTNPTWAASYTQENTPSNLALTSSWQKFTIEGVAIDTSGVNNIAIVIWVDDGTIAAADDFYITQVQLNEGSKAMPYQPRLIGEETALCQRYYQKYTEPHLVGVTEGATTNTSRLGFMVPTQMRTTPTATFGALPLYDGTATRTISSINVSYINADRIEVDASANSAWAAGGHAVVSYSAGSATLVLDAEM